MNIKNTIFELKERIDIYSKELEFNILEDANLIVEVKPLTVGTDSFGKVIVQNVIKPTQFTQKSVDEIIKIKWLNGKGENVEPVVYKRIDWYKEKLKTTSDVLDLIYKNMQNFENSIDTNKL